VPAQVLAADDRVRRDVVQPQLIDPAPLDVRRSRTDDGCDADHVGTTVDVPYRADYFFYRTDDNHPEGNLRCGAP